MKKLYLNIFIVFFSALILVNCGDDDSEEETKAEICDNGADDDNDGFVDCEDFECTCEICNNGIDDDEDGFIDEQDSDCSI